MTTTFTPGPWQVRWHGSGDSANGASVVAPDGTRVLSLPRQADRPYYQKVADANLIAAAPEMYGLLRLFMDLGAPDDLRFATEQLLAKIDGSHSAVTE